MNLAIFVILLNVCMAALAAHGEVAESPALIDLKLGKLLNVALDLGGKTSEIPSEIPSKKASKKSSKKTSKKH